MTGLLWNGCQSSEPRSKGLHVRSNEPLLREHRWSGLLEWSELQSNEPRDLNVLPRAEAVAVAADVAVGTKRLIER